MTGDEVIAFITKTGASFTQRREPVFETRPKTLNEKGEALETERVQTGERSVFTLTIAKPLALEAQGDTLEACVGVVQKLASDFAALAAK